MASINMKSILAKTQKFMNSSEGKKLVQEAVDKKILGGVNFHTGSKDAGNIYQAAHAFIDVLRSEIQSSIGTNYIIGRISQDAANEFMNIECGEPEKVKDGVYRIPIYFADDLHRESVAPEKYPRGVDNIIDLLNAGYPTDGKARGSIQGKWKGRDIFTIPSRAGARFIESAIMVFMRDYAALFNVVSVNPSSEYRTQA